MANVQIPDLPAAIGLDGSEELEMVQGGTSKRATSLQIAALAGGVSVTEPANTVYAGPTSGAPALPAFRALVTADFPVTGVTAGTYGDATHIPAVTVDATGRVTAASNIVATGTVSSVGLSMPSEFSVANSPVTTSGTLTVTWNAPVTAAHGGTGQSSYTIGDLLYASGATALSKLADVATGNALLAGGVGAAPLWGKVDVTTTITGILPVANGGTGLASGTSGGVLAYTASGTLASSGALTANALVLGGGAGAVPTVLGSLGTTTTVLHGNAAGAPTFGAVSLTADITGTLGAGNGGTGNASYAVGDILYASGATTLSKLADVATGNALISGGVTTAPSWGKIGLTTHVSGTLPIANGGTNATTQIGAWDSITAVGTTIPSASTINLTTATGPMVDISGTTTITGVTLAQGATRTARATGAFYIQTSASLVVNGDSAGYGWQCSVNDILYFEGFAGSVVAVWVVAMGGPGGYNQRTASTTAQTRNAIINGDMSVAQRGTSFSTPASNAYTLDRWFVFYDGTIGTFTISQNTWGAGLPSSRERTYYLQWNQTAAGSGSTARLLVTRLPNVRTLAGQSVTVSFYGQADSTRTVGIQFTQFFGTGGSPSASVTTALTSQSVTSGALRYFATATLPSLSGKTLGSNGDDYLQLAFSMPLNVTFALNIWDVQLELGVNPSEFARQSFQDQVQACLPYYEKSFTYATAPAQNVGTNTGEWRYVAAIAAAGTERAPTTTFKAQKLKTPTITIYNPAAANAQVRDIQAAADCSATTSGNINNNGFVLFCTGNASTAVGNSLGFHWTAEAEL